MTSFGCLLLSPSSPPPGTPLGMRRPSKPAKKSKVLGEIFPFVKGGEGTNCKLLTFSFGDHNYMIQTSHISLRRKLWDLETWVSPMHPLPEEGSRAVGKNQTVHRRPKSITRPRKLSALHAGRVLLA